MSLSVRYVQTDFVHQTWPLVEEHLTSALKFGDGEYSADQIKTLLSTGTWLLLVAIDEDQKIHGAATVSFTNMPNHRIAFITALGGKALINDGVYEQLSTILKGLGATKIQCVARESAARLYAKVGFKEKHTILEIDI
jgi:hypothetical protein